MAAKSQIWQPLDPSKKEFRVFVIEPNTDSAKPPSGKLQVVSTDDKVEYDAISYAWSHAGDLRPIYIDGYRHLVSPTLETTLRHAEFTLAGCTIWCDAICINQGDLEEKGPQVELMAEIFTGARIVRIFLHPDNSTSHWVGRAVSVILQTARATKLEEARVDDQPFCPTHLEWALGLGLDPYWGRLWPLQEFAVAKAVVFHHTQKSFNLDLLTTFSKKVISYQHENAYQMGRLEERSILDLTKKVFSMVEIRDAFFHTSVDRSFRGSLRKVLVDCLFEVRQRQVTDTKDRVYGLLALCQFAVGSKLVTPNYRLSLQDIYTDFTFHFMQKSGSLVLFGQTSISTNTTASLPSWVPDYSSRYDFSTERWRHDRCYFSAGGKTKLAAYRDPTGRLLRLRGLSIDHITHVGAINDARWDSLVRWHAVILRLWIAQFHTVFAGRANRTYLDNSQDLTRSLTNWSVFCITIFLTEFIPVYKTQIATPESLAEQGKLHASTGKVEYPEDMLKALSHIRGWIGKRRLFVTSQGYLGLGSPDTEVGDSLFILAGGTTPYILRQFAPGATNYSRSLLDLSAGPPSDHYHFVGNCYVYGIMDGEAVRNRLDDFREIWLV